MPGTSWSTLHRPRNSLPLILRGWPMSWRGRASFALLSSFRSQVVTTKIAALKTVPLLPLWKGDRDHHGIQEADDLAHRVGLRDDDASHHRLHLLRIAGHVQNRQSRETLAISPRDFPAVCFRHADVGQQGINGNVSLQQP